MKRIDEPTSAPPVDCGPTTLRLAAGEEHALIRRVLKGDREQFRYFVIGYKDQMFSLVRRQVSDIELAKDLTQEIFVRAFTGLANFRFESAFSTWLTCIAMNHLHSFFASRRFRESKRTTDLESVAAEGGHSDPIGEAQITAKFQRALALLSAPQREVLALIALEGKSYEEVAGMLGIPLGTVRSRLNKARTTLKEILKDDDK